MVPLRLLQGGAACDPILRRRFFTSCQRLLTRDIQNLAPSRDDANRCEDCRRTPTPNLRLQKLPWCTAKGVFRVFRFFRPPGARRVQAFFMVTSPIHARSPALRISKRIANLPVRLKSEALVCGPGLGCECV